TPRSSSRTSSICWATSSTACSGSSTASAANGSVTSWQMSDLDKYLIPTETPVVVTTRHWASMLKASAIALLVLLIGLWLLGYTGDDQAMSSFAVLLILAALGWYGWQVLRWRTEEFVITDRRVLLIDGLLTRRVAIMPLAKVTDLTYRRSIAGRLLGYGTFVVESAGQHQAFNQIDYLPAP